MYHRNATTLINKFAQSFPVVGITGPRQSGKTTLAKHCFSNKPYISFEDPDVRNKIQNDPRAFLAKYIDGAIFDEVQLVPDLFSYLQGIVDSDDTPGRFVVTGSQNFALSSQIAQSLAGRIGIATLLPLSVSEISDTKTWKNLIVSGGYPRLHKYAIDPSAFYPSYMKTYIEQDVRQIKNIENLGTFHRFVKLCAGRTGQLLNLTSLAQAAGITDMTARRWLSVLEASFIIFYLQPYHRNFNKRLIKSPKLYFYDTGLACSLLDINSVEQLDTHYHQGALFENLVVSELTKERLHRGRWGNLYFWRDRTGNEVDVIAEWGPELHAIEIKSSQTFNSGLVANLQKIQSFADTLIHKHLISNSPDTGSHLDVDFATLQGLNALVEKWL